MTGIAAKRRSVRIDALKFFAIALVVLGHVISLPRYGGVMGGVYYVIRVFNMPLFMFLAGYVLFGREGRAPAPFIQRKFFALMVPYFAWSVFDLIRLGAPAGWVRSLGLAVLNPHVGGSKWFLYVLFVFYVIFVLVRRISTRDAWLVAAAVITVGLTFLPEGDYLGRNNIQWLFTFFVAGYLLAKHRSRLPATSVWVSAAAAVAFTLLLAVGWPPADGSGWPPWFIARSGDFFNRWWQWSLPAFLLWKYATAFSGIAVSTIAYSYVNPRWLRWQAAAGRRSLGIYVTQSWLMLLAAGAGVLGVLGSWILILFVSLAVAMLLEKAKWTRVLFLGLPAGPGRARST